MLAGLPWGFGIGCLIGVAVGVHHAWFVFSLARLSLAAQGRLPLRLMTFLDDAHPGRTSDTVAERLAPRPRRSGTDRLLFGVGSPRRGKGD